MCAWCRYTLGRFERTYGDVFEWTPGFFQRFTPHHDTRHNTTRRQTETETEGEEGTKEKTTRQEQREERRVKREKIHFQCGGAWPFFIGVVILRLIPFAHETLAS